MFKFEMKRMMTWVRGLAMVAWSQIQMVFLFLLLGLMVFCVQLSRLELILAPVRGLMMHESILLIRELENG